MLLLLPVFHVLLLPFLPELRHLTKLKDGVGSVVGSTRSHSHGAFGFGHAGRSHALFPCICTIM